MCSHGHMFFKNLQNKKINCKIIDYFLSYHFLPLRLPSLKLALVWCRARQHGDVAERNSSWDIFS